MLTPLWIPAMARSDPGDAGRNVFQSRKTRARNCKPRRVLKSARKKWTMTEAVCKSTHPSTFVAVCTGRAAYRLVVQSFNGDIAIIAAYAGPGARRNAIVTVKKLNLAF